MDRFSEIREADADAATTAIYRDIRTSCALPQVNLIYRHLATLPGVLPAVWHAIRPWMMSGEADKMVADILTLPGRAEGIGSQALTDDERATMINLLGVYARGNALNLIALSGVRRRLETPGLSPAPVPPQRQMALPVVTIPPLPQPTAVPPLVSPLISALTDLHDSARHGVTPSLYLHLAHWPALLSWAAPYVTRYTRQGGLAADRASLLAMADSYGAAGCPGTIAPLPPAITARALFAITLFTRSVIPDLIAVGSLLGRNVEAVAAGGDLRIAGFADQPSD